MTEILVSNGGTVTTLDDPACSHVVSRLYVIFSDFGFTFYLGNYYFIFACRLFLLLVLL